MSDSRLPKVGKHEIFGISKTRKSFEEQIGHFTLTLGSNKCKKISCELLSALF